MMEINSMSSFGMPESEIKYSDTYPMLDSSELVEGVRYKRVAFAVNNSSGVDKRSMGYFTFYLKSIDNATLSGQLFNVASLIDKGFTANLLVHKPVFIDFTAQIYMGRWSLILHEIKLWEGYFDRKKFISSLEVDTSFIEQISSLTDINVQLEQWKLSSFAELGDYNIGAFAVVADSVLRRLKSYAPLWDIDVLDLLSVALVTLGVKFRYYELIAEYPFIRPEERLNILNSKLVAYKDNTLKDVMLDATSAILGIGKPQHLYAVLVCNAIDSSIKDMRTIYAYKSLPKGSSMYFEGSELTKY